MTWISPKARSVAAKAKAIEKRRNPAASVLGAMRAKKARITSAMPAIEIAPIKVASRLARCATASLIRGMPAASTLVPLPEAAIAASSALEIACVNGASPTAEMAASVCIVSTNHAEPSGVFTAVRPLMRVKVLVFPCARSQFSKKPKGSSAVPQSVVGTGR